MFDRLRYQASFLNRAIRDAYRSQRLVRQAHAGEIPPLSAAALAASRDLRGKDRPPAIMLHGVMPRSGTVYVGELIRLHPRVHAYANDLWELPFLELSSDIQLLQQRFHRLYRSNGKRMGELDFLALFGGAMMGYLHSFVPDGKRLLMKVPEASGLPYFSRMFPDEVGLMLMRDGRDVVGSTLKTWPGKRFSEVTANWERNARLMLQCTARGPQAQESAAKLHLYRYEDVRARPDGFIRDFCERYDLPVDEYPFHAIDSLPSRGSSSTKRDGNVTWEPEAKEASYNPTGHWRSWKQRDLSQFYRIAGATLEAAGYQRRFD